jgi:hypothetical protein
MKFLSIIVQFLFIAAVVALAVYMFYDVIALYFEEQYGISIKKKRKRKHNEKHLDNNSEDCNCCADGGCDCDNGGLPQEAR